MAEASKKNWFEKNYAYVIAAIAAIAITAYLLRDKMQGLFSSSTGTSTDEGSQSGSSTSSGQSSFAPGETVGNSNASVDTSTMRVGDIVSVASGHSNVNIRNSPNTSINTNIVKTASGGSRLGILQYTSTVAGRTWIAFTPDGNYPSATIWYIAAEYATVSPSSNIGSTSSLPDEILHPFGF